MGVRGQGEVVRGQREVQGHQGRREGQGDRGTRGGGRGRGRGASGAEGRAGGEGHQGWREGQGVRCVRGRGGQGRREGQGHHRQDLPTLAASRVAISGARSATPTQACLSRPPCSGRPASGSGLGSSMRWIMSGPTHSHAPRYGSLLCGRAGLMLQPGTTSSTAVLMLQPGSTAGLMLQPGSKAGLMLQPGSTAGLMHTGHQPHHTKERLRATESSIESRQRQPHRPAQSHTLTSRALQAGLPRQPTQRLIRAGKIKAAPTTQAIQDKPHTLTPATPASTSSRPHAHQHTSHTQIQRLPATEASICQHVMHAVKAAPTAQRTCQHRLTP